MVPASKGRRHGAAELTSEKRVSLSPTGPCPLDLDFYNGCLSKIPRQGETRNLY